MVYPLALGVCVAIGLWVLLVLLHVDQSAGVRCGWPRPIVSNDGGAPVKQMQAALIKGVGSIGQE